jgi:hypothetical protein
MSDPAKKAASRAASRKIAAALRGLSYDDVYSLLSSHLHACFDQLPDASVNMLLMFFITHAMEARAARAEGRDANYHTAHQLTRWADIRRDEAGVHITVRLTAVMAHPSGMRRTRPQGARKAISFSVPNSNKAHI